MKKENCHCNRTKVCTQDKKRKLVNRLNRIEGQVKGIHGMIENNAYCTDVLTQVSAINAALASFSKELLADHIKTCVVKDIRHGKDEVIDDLLCTLQKMMK